MSMVDVVSKARTVLLRSAWRRLEVKLAASISLLVALGLIVLGAIDALAARRQATEQVALLQHAQASEVAWALHGKLDAVTRQVEAIAKLPWEVVGWLGDAERRNEYQRLLTVATAVDRVSLVSQEGVERLIVSRREPDQLLDAGSAAASKVPSAPSGIEPGPYRVVLARGFDTTLRWSVSDAGSPTHATVVDVNLRRLASDLRHVLATPGRSVYVADAAGTIVLHRDPGVMLGKVSLADRIYFRPVSAQPVLAVLGNGLDNAEALVTSLSLAPLPWRVYVEQPAAQAMQPVREVVARTFAITLLWLMMVLALGWYLARRITGPIRMLTAGAARLAEGQLDTRIEVRSGDEVGELADRFNTMAAALQDTIADQDRRIAEKTQALERANRNKTEFLANMSHELRTPLQAVIGFAESLRDHQQHYGALTPKQDHYVREIHGSGAHLLSLINDLLDLNKVEAGQMELALGDCDVAAVVERSLMFVRQAALSRGLDLSVSVEPPDLQWRADPRRLKQILTNLLANAVKFTEAGSVSVHARVVDDALCIDVRDTGRGIAPEDLPYLCEPFRQMPGAASPTEDRAVEGTGLGLALVRQLAQLHGGTLEWQSELGVGSSFRVRLPRGTAP